MPKPARVPLQLDSFLPYRLSVLSNTVSTAIAGAYRERFGLAFPAGHQLEQRDTVHVTDVRGETYLSRINCEYRDYLGELCRERGMMRTSATRLDAMYQQQVDEFFDRSRGVVRNRVLRRQDPLGSLFYLPAADHRPKPIYRAT